MFWITAASIINSSYIAFSIRGFWRVVNMLFRPFNFFFFFPRLQIYFSTFLRWIIQVQLNFGATRITNGREILISLKYCFSLWGFTLFFSILVCHGPQNSSYRCKVLYGSKGVICMLWKWSCWFLLAGSV